MTALVGHLRLGPQPPGDLEHLESLQQLVQCDDSPEPNTGVVATGGLSQRGRLTPLVRPPLRYVCHGVNLH